MVDYLGSDSKSLFYLLKSLASMLTVILGKRSSLEDPRVYRTQALISREQAGKVSFFFYES